MLQRFGCQVEGLWRRLEGLPRKVGVKLPGKGNSNPHGARTFHLIITLMKLIRTSVLSIKSSLSVWRRLEGSFDWSGSRRSCSTLYPTALAGCGARLQNLEYGGCF